MNILFIGDIVGRCGREVLAAQLKQLKQTHQAEMVIVNCENAAAGFGVTAKIAEQFFDLGIDVLTSGNHIWDRKEIFSYIETQPKLLRPHNFPQGTPGSGVVIHEVGSYNIAVVNLMGQVFMGATLACPFTAMNSLLAQLEGKVDAIFVDFHAEATSEKQALAHYLDGKVAAVVGTHTHVPTADERVFPQGTAYISDVGMTGDYHSVLGMNAELSLQRFLTKLPQRLEVAQGAAILHGVVVELDMTRGLSRRITRVKAQ